MLTRHGLGLLDLNKDQQKDGFLQISGMLEWEDSDSIWPVPALNLTEWKMEAREEN